jgi:hypothetical protein
LLSRLPGEQFVEGFSFGENRGILLLDEAFEEMDLLAELLTKENMDNLTSFMGTVLKNMSENLRNFY